MGRRVAPGCRSWPTPPDRSAYPRPPCAGSSTPPWTAPRARRCPPGSRLPCLEAADNEHTSYAGPPWTLGEELFAARRRGDIDRLDLSGLPDIHADFLRRWARREFSVIGPTEVPDAGTATS
jgi:hypothetical protein